MLLEIVSQVSEEALLREQWYIGLLGDLSPTNLIHRTFAPAAGARRADARLDAGD